MNNTFVQYTLFIGLGSSQASGIADSLIQQIENAAVASFGGYSHSIVEGGWRSPSGQIHREQSLKLEIVCEAPADQIEAFAAYAKGLFDQESILVLTSSPDVRFL